MTWKAKPQPSSDIIATLQQEVIKAPIVCALLAARGIQSFEEAKAFFRGTDEDIHNPFLMKDMDKAVGRLCSALEEGEKIMFFGDYDVDGTTAVSIMYSFLIKHYDNIIYYIPDRYHEGYGVSIQGIDHAKAEGVALMVTLDCGIKAVDKVDYANEKGVDIIICDHHLPGDVLPAAVAILDPKRKDCKYPYKGLSGAGVGYKLLQGLCAHLRWDENKLNQQLDLLAISIAADIVPVTGENRALAKAGLKVLNSHQRIGLRVMKETLLQYKNKDKADVSQIPDYSITDIVFKIAPRINAAGRMESGNKAVALLINENDDEARELCKSIEENNKDRRVLDLQTKEEALEMIAEDDFYKTSLSTVVFKDDWHKGVIGIVASRLIEADYKPTIVLTESKGTVSGSARSIENVDIHEAISACSEHLIQFGGHPMAAGLTMKPENVIPFRKRFDEVIAEMLNGEKAERNIEYDLEIDFDDINDGLWKVLKQFAPFGPENMRPIFLVRNVMDANYSKAVGADSDHLKFHVQQLGKTAIMKGIGFNMGEWEKHLKEGNTVDILFTLDENHWNGNTTVEMMVKEIRKTVN